MIRHLPFLRFTRTTDKVWTSFYLPMEVELIIPPKKEEKCHALREFIGNWFGNIPKST